MPDTMIRPMYVGLDVHKETIAVAVAEADRREARSLGTIANNTAALDRLLRKLKTAHPGRRWIFCYEAGPCGYPLARRLRRLGHECDVIAPSLIPSKPGNRIKTDRRDALQLARLLRAGELTAVRVPDEALEALRDLSRAREDLQRNERRLRQNLSGLLLRHERVYRDLSTWTQKHGHWLNQQHFDQAHTGLAFQGYRQSLALAEHQRRELERQLLPAVIDSSYTELQIGLGALRGIDELASSMLLAELGELTRFPKPTQLSAFVGLIPSEASSGSRRRLGAITKTGNAHVRRLLIECAQSYQHPAALTPRIRRRYERCSPRCRRLPGKRRRGCAGASDGCSIRAARATSWWPRSPASCAVSSGRSDRPWPKPALPTRPARSRPVRGPARWPTRRSARPELDERRGAAPADRRGAIPPSRTLDAPKRRRPRASDPRM